MPSVVCIDKLDERHYGIGKYPACIPDSQTVSIFFPGAEFKINAHPAGEAHRIITFLSPLLTVQRYDLFC